MRELVDKYNLVSVFVAGVTTSLMLFLVGNMTFSDVDDGVFMYLAMRLLEGGIYGVDVVDTHAGYHTFVNAWLFTFLPDTALTLRYPIFIMQVVQSMLVAYALRTHGALLSASVAIFISSVGYVHFLSASPAWYCLFFAFLSVFLVLEYKESKKRNFTLGLLVGLSLMFRHPSGIFLGLGILALFLWESKVAEKVRPKEKLLAYSAAVLSLGAVAFYSYIAFEPFAFLLFGLAPIIVLISFLKFNYSDLFLFRKSIVMAVGVLVSILPMLIYQIVWGNLHAWFTNTFLGGASIFSYDSFFEFKYVELLGVKWSWDFFTVFSVKDFVLWSAIFALSAVFAVRCVRMTGMFGGLATKVEPQGYVLIALLYAINSFYFQLPFYYFISFGLVVFALFRVSSIPKNFRKEISIFMISFSVLAFVFSSVYVFNFHKDKLVDSELPHIDLKIDEEMESKMKNITNVIVENTNEDETVFVFPQNPAINVISNRKSPYIHYGTVFALKDEESYVKFMGKFAAKKPDIVIFNQDQFFVDEYDLSLHEEIASGSEYEKVAEESGYLIYRLR